MKARDRNCINDPSKKQERKTMAPEPQVKKPYAEPQLREYGDIRQLTQATSNGTGDSKAPQHAS
jgi:hypothetical protein